MDTNIGFQQVGGLEGHVKRLKEMILFPFIYQDVYKKFKIKPPRGVLFYGPPGTGKTLIAGALASECSRANKKVSFFIRKGAECLSKWVGESENHLRELFEKAQEVRPTIIFFDEIDGLAPIRTTPDQVHSSVVSTLLALMDGLQSKGQVVVIGATNRIDAIDPALRRPGRFDHELYFPLPDFKARYEILMVHSKSFSEDVDTKFMKYLAADTEGYCGADLQALCSEAVMSSLRRQFPQIYTSSHPIDINIPVLQVDQSDFHKAKSSIVPASFRVSYSPRKKLPSKIRSLLGHTLCKAMSSLKNTSLSYHLLSKNSQRKYDGASKDPEYQIKTNSECGQNGLKNCIHFLLVGSAEQGQTDYLGPAILHCLEELPVTTIDIASLFETSGSPEETIIQRIRGTRKNLPGILYLPDIGSWWQIADDATKAVFLAMIRELDSADLPVLVLATANSPYDSLPPEFHELFSMIQDQVFAMENPTEKSRRKFFSYLFKKAIVVPTMKSSSDSNRNQVLSIKVKENLPLTEHPKISVDGKRCRRVRRNTLPTSSSEESYDGKKGKNVLKKRKHKSSKLCTKDKIAKLSDNCAESYLKENDSFQLTPPLIEDSNENINLRKISKDEEKVPQDDDCSYDCEVRPSSSYSSTSLDYGEDDIVSEGINSSSKLFAIDEKQLQYFIDYAVKITEDCTLETVLFLYSKIMFCMSKYKDFCDSVKLIEEFKSTMKAFEDNIAKQKNSE